MHHLYNYPFCTWRDQSSDFIGYGKDHGLLEQAMAPLLWFRKIFMRKDHGFLGFLYVFPWVSKEPLVGQLASWLFWLHGIDAQSGASHTRSQQRYGDNMFVWRFQLMQVEHGYFFKCQPWMNFHPKRLELIGGIPFKHQIMTIWGVHP